MISPYLEAPVDLGSRTIPWILGGVGALLVIALQWVAIERQSLTTDEPFHVYAGFYALRYGTNALNLEHPPLVKLLAAAPLALEREPYAPRVPRAEAVTTGEMIFDGPERTLERTRRLRLVLLACIALPLLVACFELGRRWADPLTGTLLALATGLSLSTLPYLSLAINDAAVALGVVLTLLAAERFLRRPEPVSGVLLGACWGLALTAKLSALLVAPTVAVAILLAPLRHPRDRWTRAAVAALTLSAAAAVMLIGYLAANRAYDPAIGRRALSDYARGEVPLVVEDRLERWEPRLLAIERVSPAAAQWSTGVLAVTVQSSLASLPSFAFGSVDSYGRWWYFPAVLLVKTPLVILAAGGVAVVLAWRQRRAGRRSQRTAAGADPLGGRRLALALITVGFFLAAAVTSSYNHGVRYLLPVLPLLYLPAAWAAARRPLAAALFVVLLAAEAVALAPRWMSATNTWWLGEHNPTRFALSASDLEFHQNFRLLAEDLERRGVEEVAVAFPALGPRRLHAYLPGARVADPTGPTDPGWHAVTVALEQYVPAILDGSPQRIHRFDRFRRSALHWQPYLDSLQKGAEDHGIVGATFHLYRVPAPYAPSFSQSLSGASSAIASPPSEPL